MTAPPPGPSDDPTHIDLGLWAKERNLRGKRYPHILRALDATAAALVLWDAFLSPGVRRRVAAGLGADEARARALVAFWTGCHDIGKLIREFQEQIPLDLSAYPRERPPGDRTGHSLVTRQWLTTALLRLGYPGEDEYVSDLVARLLGGHHGVYPDPLDEYTTHRFADGPWNEQREHAALLVHEAADSPAPPERLDAAVAPLVCGLVILADWLVSQERFLLDRLKTPPADNGRPALLAHFHASFPAVTRLVDDAGLCPLTTSPASFAASFPTIEKPNGLQSSLARYLSELCSDGGLVPQRAGRCWRHQHLGTVPPGKQNATAAMPLPDLAHVAVRSDRPVSFAPAFESAVRHTEGFGAASVSRLDGYAEKINGLWWPDAVLASAYAGIDDKPVQHLGERVPGYPKPVDTAVAVAGPGTGEIGRALPSPHWQPYLGRRSFVPDPLLVPGTGVADPGHELRTAVPLPHRRVPEGNTTVAVGLVSEQVSGRGTGSDTRTVLNDVPRSFASAHRRYIGREVRVEEVDLPAHLVATGRHDYRKRLFSYVEEHR